MKPTNFISCYGDSNGFGIVAGEKKQLGKEIYLTFLEDEFIEKVSIPAITEKIIEFRDRYSVSRGYANKVLQVLKDQHIGVRLDFIPEINLDEKSFTITCLMNDGKLRAKPGYEARMLEVINSFDKEQVNHICYALLYGIDLKPDPTAWLSML